ncbi:alpha/beta hydrolase [Brevibacterium sp. 50QC2O2]|uniref:alpha/beta fold hydrolase n=1 Tax=Brevibacterium sp. 50QC2O2 TaxID=2968459 RepID=UPI00211C5E3C|nr:alpha/beta hydrolase [Brevibacterium sp. 50QC2O2]MCQ9387265.1 alpha/beta hydrolase [Brevibacterium sp. 50QC2O2]
MTDAQLMTLPDGRTLAWAWYGDPSGRPAFFLHGTPGGRLSGAAYADFFERNRLHVACPDRPGYGGSSSRPPEPHRPVSGGGLMHFSADLHELWERIRPAEDARALVIAGSGGAPYGLAFAAGYPQDVDAVGVFSGIAPMEPDEAETLIDVNRRLHTAANHLAASTVTAGGKLPVSGDALEGLVADVRWAILSGELIGEPDAAIRDALVPGADGMVVDYSSVFARNWGFDPGDVQADVRWVHGTQDVNAPLSAARRYAGLIPNCEFHPVDGGGHRPSSATLDWLFAELQGSARPDR